MPHPQTPGAFHCVLSQIRKEVSSTISHHLYLHLKVLSAFFFIVSIPISPFLHNQRFSRIHRAKSTLLCSFHFQPIILYRHLVFLQYVFLYCSTSEKNVRRMTIQSFCASVTHLGSTLHRGSWWSLEALSPCI
jgi:hypothetical protein